MTTKLKKDCTAEEWAVALLGMRSKRKSEHTPERWEVLRERHRVVARNWRHRNPEKVREQAKRYVAAHPEIRAEQERRYRERHPEKFRRMRNKARARRRATVRALRPEALASAFLAALNANELFAVARAAVPRTLPRHIQDDAIQSIILAVLEEEVPLADVAKHARKFVSASWGLMDKYRHVSLDEVIPGTEGIRRIDTIDSERLHF